MTFSAGKKRSSYAVLWPNSTAWWNGWETTPATVRPGGRNATAAGAMIRDSSTWECGSTWGERVRMQALARVNMRVFYLRQSRQIRKRKELFFLFFFLLLTMSNLPCTVFRGVKSANFFSKWVWKRHFYEIWENIFFAVPLFSCFLSHEIPAANGIF